MRTAHDHLPVLVLVGDFIGGPQLGVGGAAHDEDDETRHVLLRRRLRLVLVPLAVTRAEKYDKRFLRTHSDKKKVKLISPFKRLIRLKRL